MGRWSWMAPHNSAGRSVAKTMRSWHPHYGRYLRKAALTRWFDRSALRAGHDVDGLARQPRPYTRFLVVAQPRCGTTLLQGLLAQHPELVMHGEVLRARMRMDLSTFRRDWDGEEPDDAWRLLRADYLRFVDEGLWPHRSAAVAIGAKYFEPTARVEKALLRPYLEVARDVHVVRLVREDRLAWAVSQQRAQRDRRWRQTIDHPSTGTHVDPVPVAIEPERAIALAEHARETDRRLDLAFADRPTLRLTYEQLAADPPAVAAKVFAFLGAAPHAVTPRDRKTSRRALRDDIADFDALDRGLARTEWAHLTAAHRGARSARRDDDDHRPQK